MNSIASAPGFFGKLPSHGDFVGRRLPPTMRDPFDAWLQRGILASKDALGASWQKTWLSSPLWRFVLAPGLCGPESWSGVMVPSMDKVGRCFPFITAAPSVEAPSLVDCIGRHEDWFIRLEEIALATLDKVVSLDRVDAALIALGGIPMSPGRAWTTTSSDLPQCAALEVPGMPPLVFEDMKGGSAWWGEGSDHVAPCVARCRGLPKSAWFAGFLDGAWSSHGWQFSNA